MHYARYIDNLKRKYIDENPVLDYRNYHFYKDIEVIGIKKTNQVVCLKQGGIKIIIKEPSSGIKLYLDSCDIVSLLIELLNTNKVVGQSIISSLYDLLKNKSSSFRFKIDNEEFVFNGLPIFDDDLMISTKADFNISINEFISNINLILSKEEYSPEKNAFKNEVCKYLSLTEYYGLNDSKAKKLLNKLRFPVYKDLYENRSVVSSSGKKKFVFGFDVFEKYKLL